MREKGQALLLVLLLMAVVLIVVLSVVSSSVTDISVSTREEEAIRAFSAAEAGIEKALIVGSDIGQTAIGDASFTATVSEHGQAASSFVYPQELAAGDTATFWLVSHDDDDSDRDGIVSELICNAFYPCFKGRTMKVCWGASGTGGALSTTPAVELSVYYLSSPGNYGTAVVAREALDPNSSRRTNNNSFSAPDAGTCSLEGKSFAFQKTLDLGALGVPAASYTVDNGLQMARVRLFYNTDVSQPIGVDVNFAGNSLLPSQGNRIESVGVAGESTRKVEVFRLYPDLPPIFESTAFGVGGLSK